MAKDQLELSTEYKYGFRDPDVAVFRTEKGLSRRVVEQISEMKGEPGWMREIRLKALDIFLSKPMPTWGGDLSELNFDDIYYYSRPTDRQGRSWDEVPEDIKRTFDRLGIPEAEQKCLAGVSAQYDSEVVYHSLREDLEKQGVIFCDTDTAVREYPDLVREYFATISPAPGQQVRRPQLGGLERRLASSTSLRGSRWTSRSRPTSASTPRTWASSSGR